MEPKNVELSDDPVGVPDEVLLYRRVHWDGIGGKDRAPVGLPARLSDNCFRDYKELKAQEFGFSGPCMSIAVGAVLAELGFEPGKVLEDFPEYGLARISAGKLRVLKKGDDSGCPQGIMLSPTDKEPWHGVVFDLNERPRTKAVAKAIVRIAEWEIPLIRSVE